MTFLKRMSSIHLCQKTLGKKRQEESQLFKTPLLGKTMTRVGEIRFLGLLIKASYCLHSRIPLLYPYRSHHFISGGFVKVVLDNNRNSRETKNIRFLVTEVRFDSISKPQNHSDFYSG